MTRCTINYLDTATFAEQCGVRPPETAAYLSVLSVPLADMGGYVAARTSERDLLLLLGQIDAIRRSADVVASEPLDHMLSWATAFAYQDSDLGGQRSVELRGQFDVAGEALITASGLQLVSTGSPPAEAFYMQLRQEPLFTVRNSPPNIKSLVELGTAMGPGAITAFTDPGGAATIATTAFGLFVVYVAVPAMRGLGQGLEFGIEHVVKDWIMSLRPGREELQSPKLKKGQ